MSETDFTDFPWKEAQQLVDAWMEGKYERPLNGGDVSDLETRIRSALATAEQETREKVVRAVSAFIDEWLSLFSEGPPIQFTPARQYASDAMRDLKDAIERDFLSEGRGG